MKNTTKFLKIIVFSLLEALTIGLLWDKLFDAGHIILASLATFLLLAVEHETRRMVKVSFIICATASGYKLYSARPKLYFGTCGGKFTKGW